MLSLLSAPGRNEQPSLVEWRAKTVRARHARGIARTVTHGMDDQFVVCDFVENQIGVRRGRHAPDGRVVGKRLSADDAAVGL